MSPVKQGDDNRPAPAPHRQMEDKLREGMKQGGKKRPGDNEPPGLGSGVAGLRLRRLRFGWHFLA